MTNGAKKKEKERKENEYDDLQDFVCRWNWFVVSEQAGHETMTSSAASRLSPTWHHTATMRTSTSAEQPDVEKFIP